MAVLFDRILEVVPTISLLAYRRHLAFVRVTVLLIMTTGGSMLMVLIWVVMMRGWTIDFLGWRMMLNWTVFMLSGVVMMVTR